MHEDDILCLGHQEPHLLASGGYDGEIAVWNVDVERPICRLNASSSAHCSRRCHPVQSSGHLRSGKPEVVGSEQKDYDGARSDGVRSDDVRRVGSGRGKDERAVEKVGGTISCTDLFSCIYGETQLTVGEHAIRAAS